MALPPSPPPFDCAMAEFRRREAAWDRKLRDAWSAHERGKLQEKRLLDLVLWEEIVNYARDSYWLPEDIEAAASTAEKTVELLRERLCTRQSSTADVLLWRGLRDLANQLRRQAEREARRQSQPQSRHERSAA